MGERTGQDFSGWRIMEAQVSQTSRTSAPALISAIRDHFLNYAFIVAADSRDGSEDKMFLLKITR